MKSLDVQRRTSLKAERLLCETAANDTDYLASNTLYKRSNSFAKDYNDKVHTEEPRLRCDNLRIVLLVSLYNAATRIRPSSLDPHGRLWRLKSC